jgi:serine kinase of HPr protein (carbohydrate metabolism regulator)
MAAGPSTIHASAVLVGRKAALIRGPSGSGKSRLAWELIRSALPFARLVADDRAFVEIHSGRPLVRPAPNLAGLIEVRGLGIRRLAYEPVAAVGMLIDLVAADAERHPSVGVQEGELEGVRLRRLALATGIDPLPAVLAELTTVSSGN